MPKSFAWIFLLLALLPGIAHSADVTVQVTGMGETRTEALEDATRQAVQLALEQLVVTDRKIVNDELVRDETISTLNGFIKKRKILATRKVDGQVEVDAQITVSRKQITNYIGEHSADQSGSNIDGNSLGSEIERQRSAAKSSNALIQRLMRGFPLNATDVRIKSVKVSREHRDFLEVVVQLKFKKDFLEALAETAKAMSVGGLRVSRGGYFNPLGNGAIVNSWNNDPSDWWVGSGPLDVRDSAKGFSVCFSSRNKSLQHVANCYILQDTPLLDSSVLHYAPALTISLGAMSADGRLMDCLYAGTQMSQGGLYSGLNLPIRAFSIDDYARTHLGYEGGLLIGTDTATVTMFADISGKDLANMTALKGYAGLAAGNQGGRTYLLTAGSPTRADPLVVYDLSKMKASEPCRPD